MNTQFDPVMEDYLSFLGDHLPQQQEEEAFLESHPRTIGSIVTPRRKTIMEITPEERTARHIRWMEEQDKFAVYVASSSASAGPTESDAAYRKRFGLMSLRDLGKSAKIEPVAIHINGEAIYIDEALSIDLYRHSWKKDDQNPCPICDGTDPAAHQRFKPVRDILDMSWPEQREFRWNDPDGYAQWVEDLKEEMGEHFDESLVLPEFKFGERVKKLREVHSDDDLDGMFDYSSEEFIPTDIPEEAS